MLNRAHYLERQAEKAARKGRVEEAIQLHKEAADILRDLLQSVIDDKVKESVRLQAELHDKEKKVLKQQRKRCQKVRKDLETLKMNHEKAKSPKRASALQPSGGDQGLQSSIHRKFQETQHLLDQLRIQEDYSDCTSLDTTTTSGAAAVAATSPVPSSHQSRLPVEDSTHKKPKEDKVIIEELRTANSHLRKMVDTLFFELSACQEENIRLKSRIREMERAQRRAPPPETSPRGVRRAGSAKKVSYENVDEEEEVGGYLGMQKILPTEELPPLPPLDMPPAFNFGNNSPTPSSTLPSSTNSEDTSRCQPPPPIKYASHQTE